MDHIKGYFNNVNEKLINKKLEKESFTFIVKDSLGIDIEDKDFVVENNIIKLKIFGPKRYKIILHQEELIKKLKDKENITILEVK